MDEKKLEKLLSQTYRATPNAAWLGDLRKKILGQSIEIGSKAGFDFSALFAAHRLAWIASPILALSLILVVSGYVSRNSLPSSRLYAMKLMMESAQGTLVFSESGKADYLNQIAQERAREISELAKNKDGSSAAEKNILTQTVRRYSDAIKVSAKTVKELKDSGNQDLAKKAAEGLNKAASAYELLLNQLDMTASSNIPVLEDAKIASISASQTAEEILGSQNTEVVSNVPDGSSSSTVTSTVITPKPFVSPQGQVEPAATSVLPIIPSIIPSVVD